MKNKIIFIVVTLIFVLILINIIFLLSLKKNNINDKEYNPIINHSLFSTNINNPYFTLIPNEKLTYRSETPKGIEINEVFVTNKTKNIIGVETIIVWDRVWINNVLSEETYDYYAQDQTGNVWYFGEDSKEYISENLTSNEGSWISGIDNAKPGILMKALPKISDVYRQEYLIGKAEDMAEIISLNETITLKFGNFTNCLKTKDYSLLEPGNIEYKYYCSIVRNLLLEDDLDNKNELIGVEYNSNPSQNILQNNSNINVTNNSIQSSNIPEDKAKEIALQKVPGTITDFSIEMKSGKLTYVIEIKPNNGPETDVLIDISNGKILSIET